MNYYKHTIQNFKNIKDKFSDSPKRKGLLGTALTATDNAFAVYAVIVLVILFLVVKFIDQVVCIKSLALGTSSQKQK